jgi:hypothetical protein
MFSVPLSFQEVWRESQYPSMKLGSIGNTPCGSLWQYQQASEALSQGNPVCKVGAAAVNAGIVIAQETLTGASAVSAVNTRRINDSSGNFTVANMPAGWFKNGTDEAANVRPDRYIDLGHSYFLQIVDGAAQGQMGVIYNRASDTAVDVWWMHSDDGKLDVATSTSSEYVVTTNTRVKQSDAAEDQVPMGVVQRNGGVTDEYFFWSLIKGRGVVLWDTAVALGGDYALTVSSAEAGTVEAMSATPVSAEVLSYVGRTAVDSDSDGSKILADIDVIRNVNPENRVPLPVSLDLAWPQMYN